MIFCIILRGNRIWGHVGFYNLHWPKIALSGGDKTFIGEKFPGLEKTLLAHSSLNFHFILLVGGIKGLSVKRIQRIRYVLRIEFPSKEYEIVNKKVKVLFFL